ncbi:MAG: transposase [Candidatus Eremiobacteraeota bacterium]|nr:transposase [Candidatus Eremiobacteraeota bacterium]
MASRFEGQLRWLHKVRLYPTCAQERVLFEMLRVTRELYNALLQQRRDAWTTRHYTVTSHDQYHELTALRAVEPRFAAVYRESQDAVLHRLDLAFAAFFRRLKRGQTPGYPRYKPASRWNQLEFPHGDRALKLDHSQKRVRIPGVGAVRLRKGRLVPEFGRAFVVFKSGRWYAVFESHRSDVPLPKNGRRIGIDRGIYVLAMLSDGTAIENPRVGSRWRTLVQFHQRALDAVTQKGAAGHVVNVKDAARAAAVRRLSRAKEREANARRDWLHKASRFIVNRFDLIALEALNLSAMTRSAKGTIGEPGKNVLAKSRLNRALLDAGFGMLATLIREKAAYAAREVIEVDARYSSQTCAACRHTARGSRQRRRFVCVRCGHAADADLNAARILLKRAESPPTRAPGTARGERHKPACHAHDELGSLDYGKLHCV